MIFWYDKINGNLATPIHTPFWFIRDLIIMVVLSPIIHYIMRQRIIAIPVIAFLTICYIFNLWSIIPDISIEAIMFFSIGAFLCLCESSKDLVRKLFSYREFYYAIASTLIFVIVTCNSFSCKYHLMPIFTIIGIVCTYHIADYLSNVMKCRICDLLGSCSFFIFAFHMFVLISTGLFMDLFDIPKPESHLSLILWYFLNPAIAVGCSVFCFYVLKRFMPRTCYLLTGQK